MDSPELPSPGFEETSSSARTYAGLAWFTAPFLMWLWYLVIADPGCDGRTSAAYENTVAAIGLLLGIVFAVAAAATVGWNRWRVGAIGCGLLCLAPFVLTAVSYVDQDVHKALVCF